jgi:glyoxylase-like metal-dependent hydrolase (beta-lactamase superfamily II)
MATSAMTVDLHYLGREGIISAFLLPTGDGGFLLLDSGPASTVESLERGIAEVGFALADLRAVLLTHIHLDHAAAAGTLARRTGCQVWVHPNGLAHLSDPGDRLLPSALRLYGSRLETLFGTMEAVPEGRLRVVEHGQPVRLGERVAVGWHTPGHARHHVVWQLDDEMAMGDLAGIRLQGSAHVLPPMPPPDIDVEAWRSSLALVRELAPRRLLLTHFGGFDDPRWQLDCLEQRLGVWTTIAEEVVRGGGDVEALGARLAELDEREMHEAAVPEARQALYRKLCPPVENASGLFRYWSSKLKVES